MMICWNKSNKIMLKLLLYQIGKLSSFIFPGTVCNIITNVMKYIRAGYFSKNLNHIGRNVAMMRGVKIIGGKQIAIGDDVLIGRRTDIYVGDRPMR